jgi:anti-anti-sigma factor
MSERIGYAIVDGIGYLRLAGELRHDNIGAVDALLEHWFDGKQPAPQGLVIDLNDVSFMDSTAIGLLAAFAREARSHRLPRPTLFATHPDILDLLRSLRLDEVYRVVECATDSRCGALALTEIDTADAAAHGTAAAILKAHEALVELNEANRIAFQPVVDLLRSELS